MKLISSICDFKAVSGGYVYDEFVTANTIFYQSVFGAVCMGALGGCLGYGGGIYLGMALDSVGAIALGSLGAAAGGYFGYNCNPYAGIEPNTSVRWNVTI